MKITEGWLAKGDFKHHTSEGSVEKHKGSEL